MHVHWLQDEGCGDESVVGGKAASLSRLAALHSVPPAFAIPGLLSHEDNLSDLLVSAICEAYSALGLRLRQPNPAVAVRSSAIGEDGAESSFAGQHDTYLNIRGEDAVLDAVRRCARSAASPHALAYRRQRGLPLDDILMAVLVQALVPAEIAAVVFSANPVTGSREEVMINASWGLGESIVAGTVTPDTFIVAKAGLQLTWRDIARKTRMVVATEAGTIELDVPADMQLAPSLTDTQLQDVASLAVRLEGHLGHAVDVECAIAAGELFLLQCRPITTLR